MLQYILKRCFFGFITVFVLATLTFLLMHFVPGDPLSGEKAMNEEIKKNLMAKYHLDQPLHTQYFFFITNMFKGDFGLSFTQKNRRVNDIIREHFPISALLGFFALLFALIIGVASGSIAALNRNEWPDKFVMFMVIMGISVPSFIFAAIGQILILKTNAFLNFALLPVGGWGSLAHILVPSFVLGISTQAFISRLMRSSLLEISKQDYIKTALSKGLSSTHIFFKHQLRNAILPILTILGPSIATITTGGFVVESVFSIPGLGRYFVEAMQQLDYTVIMGLTVFYGSYLIVMVLIVDILYVLVDPRISLSE